MQHGAEIPLQMQHGAEIPLLMQHGAENPLQMQHGAEIPLQIQHGADAEHQQQSKRTIKPSKYSKRVKLASITLDEYMHVFKYLTEGKGNVVQPNCDVKLITGAKLRSVRRSPFRKSLSNISASTSVIDLVNSNTDSNQGWLPVLTYMYLSSSLTGRHSYIYRSFLLVEFHRWPQELTARCDRFYDFMPYRLGILTRLVCSKAWWGLSSGTHIHFPRVLLCQEPLLMKKCWRICAFFNGKCFRWPPRCSAD